MIIVYHNEKEVVKIQNISKNIFLEIKDKSIPNTLFLLSEEYSNCYIIWCNHSFEDILNLKKIESIFENKLMMLSYSISKELDFNSKIGYIDQSLMALNINFNVTYPTWVISTGVGGIHSSVLKEFGELKNKIKSFKLLLNYISKKGVNKGLLCYSEPRLIKSNYSKKFKKSSLSNKDLFLFVKNHYKKRWLFILFFNLLIYERNIYIFSLLIGIMGRKYTLKDELNLLSDKRIVETKKVKDISLDVLIPTLGRAKYLKDVLIDLSKQTILPKRVIIVEQNSDKNSLSELTYLKDDWPFEIDHTFIHQLGACNARNIALSKVTSNWTFFADDDIRFPNNFIENSFNYIEQYKANAITLSCLQKGEIEPSSSVHQWNAFGTNASIVKSSFLKSIRFDMSLEFGYGEDNDFGMQLRNLGCDILYVPFVKMLHLKAPIGGFRQPIIKEWSKEVIQPKPSPTIMVFNLKFLNKEQFNGYKTLLFAKYYKHQSNKNPITYIKQMNLQWKRSLYWGKKLMRNEV